VVKSVDETIQSDDTLSDDSELLFTPTINKTYGIKLVIFLESNSTADFSHAVTIPTGASCLFAFGQLSGVSDGNATDWTSATSVAMATGNKFLVFIGKLIMSSTAGNWNFQWAQTTSTAINTTVQQGSHLVVWES